MLKFSRKSYLNGIDWIVQGMHHNCSSVQGGNYRFLIVSSLEGIPDAGKLRSCLYKLQELFPLLSAKLRRNWLNLAPYWKIFPKTEPYDILKISVLEDKEDIEHLSREQITEFLNTPFTSENRISALLMVFPDGSSRFALNFDHRIFDAAGGEQILSVLNNIWNNIETNPFNLFKEDGPWLNEWKNQFSCGKTVNRVLLDVKKNGRPSVLSSNPIGVNRYSVLNLTETQFELLKEKADTEAGAMMITPYLVATIQEALHKIFRRRGEVNSVCVCPTTVNLRESDGRKLFLNHWSIMPMYSTSDFFREERIQKQTALFYSYIKTKFPYCLTKAGLLLRPLPIPFIAKFSRKIFSGTAGTATIALLNKMEFNSELLFGEKLINLYHIPRIPPAPGLGVFMNRRGRKLNITFSWIDGIINDKELEILSSSILDLGKP